MSTIHDRIDQLVKGHPVVLFMKGTPDFPQCGFSMRTVQALKLAGAADVTAINVLADPEVREGIKAYSNWPTIPQLYVNGEFVGGCDITMELYESGELEKMVQSKG
jgi:monothiol glutaredoxin